MGTPTSAPARTTYIPHMADHAHTLVAAMRHHGMPAELLSQSDADALDLGIGQCGGRECLPCFLSVGDFLRRAREPGFRAERACFFMTAAPGPCRFGQYQALLRDVLDENGLDAVEIASPSSANSYHGFGERPLQLRQLAWQGFVAVDLLVRLLHEYRPYESTPGSADALYAAALVRVTQAVEAGGGKPLEQALGWAADGFAALPAAREPARPLVGVIGEIYVRWNRYSNRDLIRQVEALGGEVMLASIREWLYFTNYRTRAVAQVAGHYGEWLRTWLTDAHQRHQEERLLRIVTPRLRRPEEASVRETVAGLRPYYDDVLGTEAVLSLGRAIDYAHAGVSGIINVMPFSCIPGVIVSGMAPRLRRDLDHLPWLDIPFDAQKETNVRTRLEAFMHQVAQFERRRVNGVKE